MSLSVHPPPTFFTSRLSCFLLSCILPIPHPSSHESLFPVRVYCIPPVRNPTFSASDLSNPFFPASLQPCIPPVLHATCPAYHLSCIPPVLHTTCSAYHLSCIPTFPHPSCPASILSCIPPVLHPSCLASFLSCIPSVLKSHLSLNPTYPEITHILSSHISCHREIPPVLHPTFPASNPSCIPSVLHLSIPLLIYTFKDVNPQH